MTLRTEFEDIGDANIMVRKHFFEQICPLSLLPGARVSSQCNKRQDMLGFSQVLKSTDTGCSARVFICPRPIGMSFVKVC